MRVAKATEWAMLLIASAAAVSISVAHLLGMLEKWPWLTGHLSTITLLLVASLLPILVGIIERHAHYIQQTLRQLQESHDRHLLERFSEIRSRVDPDLAAVFGDHIDDMLVRIERAVRERYFELDDIDLFRSFYRRTLAAFPKSTFFATSLPRQTYFWRNPQFERVMTDFIDRGVSMKRVFFLHSSSDLQDAEVAEILAMQLRMNVDVYVANWDRVPSHLRRFFAVEAQGRLAWEVFVGPAAEIEHVRATCDQKTTQRYVRDFNEILGLETTRKYVDQQSAEGAGA